MKKTMLAVVAAAAALAAAPSAAADATVTLGGGATSANGVLTLVSNTADASTANDWSDTIFTNTGVTTLSSLTRLSTQFNVTDDACGLGSPRFVIVFGSKAVPVLLGTKGAGVGEVSCEANTWLSSGNLVGSTARVFDLSQFGGRQDATWAELVALVGSTPITDIRLAVDSAGGQTDGEQTVLFRSIHINGLTFFANSPRTLAACKKGGWREFTDPRFKNQGQCVKYVVKARNAAKKQQQAAKKAGKRGG
jgi:hypothetical protein